MTAIEQKVIQCAADAYMVDASAITLDTNIREQLSNQSLKLVVFISTIEDELDVTIEIRDAAKLKTIRDFVDKVNQLAK
jgi:acyl carrier protein